MQPREAAELLALMRGTWPRLAPDEVADRLWLEDLMRCEKSAALEAFRGLRDFNDKTPSWSVFRESYQAQVRRQGLDRAAIGAPDWEPPTEEQKARVHAVVADLKAMIREKKRILDGKAAPTKAVPHRGAGTFDALAPMLTYTEVYEQEPELL